MQWSLMRVLIAGCIAYAAVHWLTHRHSVHEGMPAPDFALTLFDGREFRLADHLGEVVVVDYWASWCGPCMGEMPALQQIYEARHDAGLLVLGINVDTSAQAARPVLDTLSFPNGPAHSLVHARLGFDGAIPYTVIVGRDGKIAHVLVGAVPGEAGRRHLEALLDPLLAQAR